MKFQLLPSSFNDDGSASQRQHLACIVINDAVAFDAGSLAMACTNAQRDAIRDIVLSHTHLDHIAGLPLFIDDLFPRLEQPIRVHGTREMIASLEANVFNGSIYPQFDKFENAHGRVLEFVPFEFGREFGVGELRVTAVPVNHNEPSAGFVINDGDKSIVITGDTSSTATIWQAAAETANLSVALVECAFPDEMSDLAATARHLTPRILKGELEKLGSRDLRVYVVNIKPMYREKVVEQINALEIDGLEVLEIGREYQS